MGRFVRFGRRIAMTVVSIVGAGSVTFTRVLVSDLLSRVATHDCELRLYDVNADALQAAGRLAAAMRSEAASNGPTSVTDNLKECVKGADYVICTILQGGRSAAIRDFELAGKYGLRHTVGDTLGIAGISRAVRTIPVLLEIAKACSAYAPDGLLLNYTNPMGMLVSAVARGVGYPTVGLCHSAEHTVLSLCRYLGVPPERLQWRSAGINHLAWMLTLAMEGRDLYPDLAVAGSRQEIYDQDRVRFELLKRVGFFVTESSKHVSEYLAFFMDKPNEIERLGIPVGEYLTRKRRPLAEELEKNSDQQSWLLPISDEYAPSLIAALVSNEDWAFQGNVINDRVIDGLRANMCVEVSCLVSKGYVTPCRVTDFPPTLAALTQQSLNVQELAVEGVLNQDRDLIYQAVMLDPQASAVLDLRGMAQLADDLVKDYPGYASRRLFMFDPVPG